MISKYKNVPYRLKDRNAEEFNIETLDCTVAKVGSSEGISKTITIPSGFYCPKVVDDTLWLANIGRLRSGTEKFKVDQSGSQVKVTRFDSYTRAKNAFKGWHRDLRFHCCKNDGMLL